MIYFLSPNIDRAHRPGWGLLASLLCLLSFISQVAAAATMTTEIPASITIPDEMETRLGTLRFDDGRPDKATAALLYDNLDFQNGVQAFLNTNRAASMVAMKRGLISQGADNQTFILFEQLTDSKSLLLGANTDTVYAMLWLDTRDGPIVIESPPNTLGLDNDAWQRYVGDMGNAGPDRGKGGKYLLLPPDYEGPVPEGYYPLRSRTYGNWAGGRAFTADGDPKPAVDHIKAHFRVYPLAQADNPPETRFVNASGKDFNTVFANDFSYFEEINEVVQSEPLKAVDPEIRGLLASIGIKKGTPFAPDARMKKILTEAALVGAATARTIFYETRLTNNYYYPDSDWRITFPDGMWDFSPGGILDTEARTMNFTCCTAISPAMSIEMVGIGSQYAIASHDANKDLLDGGKNYGLHLPAGIPAKNFWSLVVYDTQTRSYLQTDQRLPSVGSQRPGLVVNPDSSVDLYFGPEAPPGKVANWVQTVPGKGWWVMLRLYGPLQTWFDKTWRPGEIKEIK